MITNLTPLNDLASAIHKFGKSYPKYNFLFMVCQVSMSKHLLKMLLNDKINPDKILLKKSENLFLSQAKSPSEYTKLKSKLRSKVNL